MKKSRAKLTPVEYVRLCLENHQPSRTRKMNVIGDVDLAMTIDGRKVRHLLPALIEGNVVADKSCGLESIGECEIKGRLKVSGSKIREISPSAKVMGSFYAVGCPNLKKLEGEYLGDAHLARSAVEEVPLTAIFARNLNLEGCRFLRSLDCRVGGILDAGYSSVSIVGPNCRIGDSVFFSNCQNMTSVGFIGSPLHAVFDNSSIRHLQDGFECKLSLSLQNCPEFEEAPILSTPEVKISRARLKKLATTSAVRELFVEECLLLSSLKTSASDIVSIKKCAVRNLSGVSKIVRHLEVRDCPDLEELSGEWKGSLSLSGLPSLKSIPETFACNGSLDIKDCSCLKSIAGHVGESLNLTRLSRLQLLGGDLSVGGDLGIFSLDTDAKIVVGCHIGGDLQARSCQVGETLMTLSVKGAGYFSNCPRLRVVRGTFGKDLHITGSSVETLGADCECVGNLAVLECDKLVSLNCHVGGNLAVSGKNLRSIGPAFFCAGNAKIFQCPSLREIRGTISGSTSHDVPILPRSSVLPKASPSAKISSGQKIGKPAEI